MFILSRFHSNLSFNLTKKRSKGLKNQRYSVDIFPLHSCVTEYTLFTSAETRDATEMWEVLYITERKREKKAKNYKTQFMQLSYIVQNAYKLKKQNKYQ